MNSKHWACPLSMQMTRFAPNHVKGCWIPSRPQQLSGQTRCYSFPLLSMKRLLRAAYERSQAEIRKLIPEASEKGITIAIENVWNKFLLSPMEFSRYLDEFEGETVTAYFDVGNIVLYGYPQHWIRSLAVVFLRCISRVSTRMKTGSPI